MLKYILKRLVNAFVVLVIIATATSAIIATGALVLVNVGMDFVWARPVPPTVILVGGVLALVQLVALRLLYTQMFRDWISGRGN